MTDYQKIKILRETGCRCRLLCREGEFYPTPETCCDLKCGDRSQCWFIDTLIRKYQEELQRMMSGN